MPPPRKFSDDDLRVAIRMFADHPRQGEQIAARLGVDVKTVQRRMKRLESRSVAPHAVRAAVTAESNVWDIRVGLQKNHERVEGLIRAVEERGVAERGEDGTLYLRDGVNQLTALIRENRAHYETAMKVLEALYRAEETKAFMEEVLAVLAEVDPDLRRRAMERIQARRSVRAAFTP
jgi:DNA-binding Lrp family transcriptional regulator